MKKNKKSVASLYIFGLLLLVLAFFRSYKIAGILSALVLFTFWIYFAYLNIRLVLKYVYIFIAMGAYATGNLMCEYIPVYLVELGTDSKYVGSFSLLALLYWISSISLRHIDSVVERKINKRKRYNYKSSAISLTKVLKKLSLSVVFVIGFVYWLIVFRKPSFLLEINRFGYASLMPNWLYKIRTIPILFSPIVYLAVMDNGKGNRSKKMRKIIITFLPFTLFSFWIGNKYGIFINLLVAFLIPLAGRIDYSRIRFKAILHTGLCVVCALTFILIMYWHLRGNNFLQIGVKFTTRLSQQGELWWAVVDKQDWLGSHFTDIDQELTSVARSFITSGREKTYGVYRLMNIYGNHSYLKRYYDVDMRLSAQGFELYFYYLGIFAYVLFPLITNFIYALITNLYANAVHTRSLSAIVYLRMLIVIQTALAQGDWYRLTSSLDLMLIMFLLYDIVLRRYYRIRKENV